MGAFAGKDFQCPSCWHKPSLPKNVRSSPALRQGFQSNTSAKLFLCLVVGCFFLLSSGAAKPAPWAPTPTHT